MSEFSDTLEQVLRSAARLQAVVPDAVLVGGSAAAMYAGHRDSFDHDHVLSDLVDRYEAVLDAVEATDGWATSVRASKPPFTIMGSLGGVEAGLRQLRRQRPLETCEVVLGADGDLEAVVVAPTVDEALRIKAYLVVQRNAVRDHLDVVALSDHLGEDEAVLILSEIDDYYLDRSEQHGSVLTALVAALADPDPNDPDVIDELPRYKGLAPRWHDWAVVVDASQQLALRLAGGGVTALRFRNVDADPSDDVTTWPYEALATAIERGLVPDWQPIFTDIRRSPWGHVARRVEEIVANTERDGVSTLFVLAVERARRDMECAERDEVATRVRNALASSRLTQADAARLVGTSASRMSTYASGKVTPSASMLLRIERVAAEPRGFDAGEI